MEKFVISENILRLAHELLEKEGTIDKVTEIEAQDGSPSSFLSLNSIDIIALTKIEHNDVTYYLGLPK